MCRNSRCILHWRLGYPSDVAAYLTWKPEFARREVVETVGSKSARLLDKNHDRHRHPSEDAMGPRFFRNRSVPRGISVTTLAAAMTPSRVAGWWNNQEPEYS